MKKLEISKEFGRIMVFVPHQDDEVLMTAGIIYQAVTGGLPVQVVIATNGDYGCQDLTVGQTRLQETLEGLRVLGLTEQAVTFLGYADTGMQEEDSFLFRLFHAGEADKVFSSSCSGCTYGLPQKPEFHKQCYGESASYTRNSFKNDLKELLSQQRPDTIFTTSEEDVHGDHSGLYLFVEEVLGELLQEAYYPEVYCGIVHSKAGDENWPLRSVGIEAFTEPDSFEKKGKLIWEDRVSFEVPEAMRIVNQALNLKAQALSKHVTALKPDAVEFLYSFLKAEEVFWKARTRIYPVEEWQITETSFRLCDNYRNETTFALSNGYLGTRGTFEEGYDFSPEEGLEGNFINGFYESEHIRYGEWNFGFPEESQSLLNLPNLKTTQIVIDGECFDMRKGKLIEYERSLQMKQGIVKRHVVWQSLKGKKVRIDTERFVSFVHKNVMAYQFEITPLNFSGSIQILSVLEAKVENHTRTTNPLVDYGPFGRHLLPDVIKAEKNMLLFQGTTQNSRISMACGSAHDCSDKKPQGSVQAEKGADLTFTLAVGQGKTEVLHKYVVYTSQLDMLQEELLTFVQEELRRREKEGYERLRQQQISYLQEFWEKADITIRGDAALQQGIRFNLFHIMQAAGRDGRTGMGAKGLSGEGYEGHCFWDTEMYVLPVFIYTDAQLAKNLLQYRYAALGDARDRARVLGHPKGALYPWRTINGKEASTYFPLGTAQYHINADIAYAFKLYVEVTKDYAYLIQEAAEVLVETARVWADVGCFAESRGGRYCICAVTGPDEYNAIVDNNFYTNLMARENLRAAVWALSKVAELDEAAYAALVNRLSLEPDEVPLWQKIIENMYFPYDEKRRIYPQDDGFLQRKPWDDSRIPPEKRHLLYENYHPLFIYRQRMSKQADAILGMLLHSNYFEEEELRRNYDFYQEVTLHHSSLSTCIFGMLASQLGYWEEAYAYFSQSARMDLDDHHHNFYAGIHAANMAGTWQGIVFGFAGLRTNAGILSFKPSIPKAWEEYAFPLHYRSSSLLVVVNRQEASFLLQNEQEITFACNGRTIRLAKKGERHCEKI